MLLVHCQFPIAQSLPAHLAHEVGVSTSSGQSIAEVLNNAGMGATGVPRTVLTGLIRSVTLQGPPPSKAAPSFKAGLPNLPMIKKLSKLKSGDLAVWTKAFGLSSEITAPKTVDVDKLTDMGTGV